MRVGAEVRIPASLASKFEEPVRSCVRYRRAAKVSGSAVLNLAGRQLFPVTFSDGVTSLFFLEEISG